MTASGSTWTSQRASISRSKSARSQHKAAQNLNDQATKVEFTGRVTAAKVPHNAAVDSAKLQAIISRMGAKLAQDIEKGMEMRY